MNKQRPIHYKDFLVDGFITVIPFMIMAPILTLLTMFMLDCPTLDTSEQVIEGCNQMKYAPLSLIPFSIIGAFLYAYKAYKEWHKMWDGLDSQGWLCPNCNRKIGKHDKIDEQNTLWYHKNCLTHK